MRSCNKKIKLLQQNQKTVATVLFFCCNSKTPINTRFLNGKNKRATKTPTKKATKQHFVATE